MVIQEMKEVNRTNLQRAIQELPSYEPPEAIWDHISQDLDRETGRRTLDKAIEQLDGIQIRGRKLTVRESNN